MNPVQYVCILGMAPTLDTPKPSNLCAHKAIKSCVRCMQTTVGELSAPSVGSKSDGERGYGSQLPSCTLARDKSCNFVRNLVLLEGEYLLKTRFWMQALIEVQQPHFVASDVDRLGWRSNTMFRLDMPSIELGVMRA